MHSLPITRRTVAVEVATRLRSRILDGSLQDGAALRQDAIAVELGVSRIPVREALAQLEAEGLVRLEPHRGAFVVELEAGDVAELFELRSALEPVLLRRAIPRMSPSDLKAAGEAARAFDGALRRGERERWGELNWQFHEVLYGPAGRSRILRIVQEISNSTARCVRLHLGVAGAVQRASEDHHALLQLCRDRRTDDAVALLTRHLEAAGRELLGLLEQRAQSENQACA